MKSIPSDYFRNQLKKVAETRMPVITDIFGYEKRAKQNILAYFDMLSEKIETPTQKIIIRIYNDRGTITSCTYRQGECSYLIPMSELILLFTGEYLDVEEKTTNSIKAILKDVIKAHQCDKGTLQLCISCIDNDPHIIAITKHGFITSIPIQKLISYFI